MNVGEAQCINTMVYTSAVLFYHVFTLFFHVYYISSWNEMIHVRNKTDGTKNKWGFVISVTYASSTVSLMNLHWTVTKRNFSPWHTFCSKE